MGAHMARGSATNDSDRGQNRIDRECNIGHLDDHDRGPESYLFGDVHSRSRCGLSVPVPVLFLTVQARLGVNQRGIFIEVYG